MTVEYRIPADHPTCPRHPGQPRDFCTPCADHYRHVMAAPVTCPACKGKPVDGDCATCEGLGAVASPTRARLAAARAAAYALAVILTAAALTVTIGGGPAVVALPLAFGGAGNWVGWLLINATIRALDAAGK